MNNVQNAQHKPISGTGAPSKKTTVCCITVLIVFREGTNIFSEIEVIYIYLESYSSLKTVII